MHPVSGNHNRLSWLPSCLSWSTMPGLTTTEYLTIAQPGLLECKDSSKNQIFSAWSSQCFSLELMHLVWELYIYTSILWAFNLCVWYHVLDSMFFRYQPATSSFFPKPGLQGMTAGGLAGRDFLSFFCPEERRTADSMDPKRCQRGYLRKCMYHVIYILATWPISNISNISNIWQAKHWNAIKGSSFCRFQMARVRKRHLLGDVAGRQNQGKSRQVFFCPVQKPHPKVPLCMVIGWCLYSSTLQWVVFKP